MGLKDRKDRPSKRRSDMDDDGEEGLTPAQKKAAAAKYQSPVFDGVDAIPLPTDIIPFPDGEPPAPTGRQSKSGRSGSSRLTGANSTGLTGANSTSLAPSYSSFPSARAVSEALSFPSRTAMAPPGAPAIGPQLPAGLKRAPAAEPYEGESLAAAAAAAEMAQLAYGAVTTEAEGGAMAPTDGYAAAVQAYAMGAMPAAYVESGIPFRQLDGAVAYPPDRPQKGPRAKPPNCHTVFCGGIPGATTKELLQELFEPCGEIRNIRITQNKGFAHVRFLHPHSVDDAIKYTGFMLQIGETPGREFSGRLNVDYAEAREDLAEYNTQLKAAELLIKETEREERRAARIAEMEKEDAEREEARRSRRTDREKERDAERAKRHEERERRDKEKAERERERKLRPPTPPPKKVRPFTEEEGSRVLEKLKDPMQVEAALELLTEWLERGECTKRTAASFFSLLLPMNGHLKRVLAAKAETEISFQMAKQAHLVTLKGTTEQISLVKKLFKAAQLQKNWDVFSKPQRRSLDQLIQTVEAVADAQQQQLFSERDETDMQVDSDTEEAGGGGAKGGGPGGFDPAPFYQAQIDALKKELEAARKLQNMEPQVIKAKPSRNRGMDEEDLRLVSLSAVFLSIHPQGAPLAALTHYLQAQMAPKDISFTQVDELLTSQAGLFHAMRGQAQPTFIFKPSPNQALYQ